MLLSLLALYNYDPTVLSGLQVPEGCDITTLRPLLLAETGELEIMYPQPAMFKIVFDAWVQSRLPQWQRMMDALLEEYNPLYNYDRLERWTDTETRNTQSARTIDRDTTGRVQDSGTRGIDRDTTSAGTTSTTASGTDTEETVGFNSAAYTPKGKRTTSATNTGSDSVTGTEDVTETTSNTETSTGTEDVTDTTRDTGTNTNVREGYARGNIGVTTSAQMLAGELEIRAQDMYQIIIQEFIRRFCLLIY